MLKIEQMMTGEIVTPPAGEQTRVSRQTARLGIYALMIVADCIAIMAGFSFAAEIRGEQWLVPGGFNLGVICVITYLFLALNRGVYSAEALLDWSENIRRPLACFAIAALLITLFSFFTQSGLLISRLAFVSATALSAIAMVVGRGIVSGVIARTMPNGLVDELLIVDGGPMPENISNVSLLDAGLAGLSPDLHNPAMLHRIGSMIKGYDRVVVTAARERQSAWAMVLKGTHVTGEILMLDTNRIGAIGIGAFGGNETMLVSRGRLSLTNRVKKRVFDLAITIPAVLFLLPLLIVVAIAIKLESRGPVLFRQKRVGQSNGQFDIWKFRSMRVEESDANGTKSASRDDDRITRVGRIIRATSIDELPQLFNVLRGDMSIVGPRPHALGSLAGDQLFWEVTERYWMRHALKPGITGLAQIRGLRGATHRKQDLELRLQSDLEYLNGWRLSRDFAILLGTLRVIVHRNAY